MTGVLKGIPETDFKLALEGKTECSHKCIDLNGVYRIITIKYFFLPALILFFFEGQSWNFIAALWTYHSTRHISVSAIDWISYAITPIALFHYHWPLHGGSILLFQTIPRVVVSSEVVNKILIYNQHITVLFCVSIVWNPFHKWNVWHVFDHFSNLDNFFFSYFFIPFF